MLLEHELDLVRAVLAGSAVEAHGLEEVVVGDLPFESGLIVSHSGQDVFEVLGLLEEALLDVLLGLKGLRVINEAGTALLFLVRSSHDTGKVSHRNAFSDGLKCRLDACVGGLFELFRSNARGSAVFDSLLLYDVGDVKVAPSQ